MYGMSSAASERSDGAAEDPISITSAVEDPIGITGLELLLSLNSMDGIQSEVLEQLLRGPMVTDIGAVKDESQLSAPLHNLCPISISELQAGYRHTGRVLYGELCADPFKMAAIHTAVVDEAGQKAKLCVYNALPSNYSQQQIQRLFAKGLKVAIREPYFKYGAMDGSLFIRVDNPADFVAVNTKSSQSTKRSSHSSSCGEPLEVLIHVRELRTQGNQAFAAKDWKQSIKLYTETLQFLLRRASPTSSTRVPSLSLLEVRQELVLAYSNRAEARLRLKHFESADEDALKALQLHPCHAKSLCRRGRALHGLHVYDEAASCFREVLRLAENGGDNIEGVREALQASEVCEKQARTGEYDLVEIMKEVKEGREPVCAEFVGPVTIGCASDEALGRGLLLTRDVDCGELLLVSKAVAKAKAHPSSLVGLPQREVDLAKMGYKSSEILRLCHMDIAKQVVQRASTSNRFREQVYSLQSSFDIDVPCQQNLPNMTLFLPKSTSKTSNHDDEIACNDDSSSHASIDVEKVCKVTMTNALETGCSLNVALWLLPSFINHSCIPNASWMTIGEEALFVRATRHLTKGEEVTIAYMDNPALPYDWRATFLRRGRGFECRCERCVFERIMKPFIEPLQTELALQKELSVETNVAVVEILEAAFQQSTTINDGNEKQWLRTSFCTSYFLTLCAMSQTQMKIKHRISLMTLLTAVQHTMGASELVVVQVQKALALGQKHNRRSKRLVERMCLCLYGKQQPTSLEIILSLRKPTIENAYIG